MKQLITVQTLDACISSDGKCYIGPNQILSPGAKDELGRRRVAIVYGPKPDASSACCCQSSSGSGSTSCCKKGSICDPDELAIAVAALLKKECGISDPAELRALTMEALLRIVQKC